MSQNSAPGHSIDLHGWDSCARAWHGPDELTFSLAGCRHIVQRLRQLPGSWHGTLQGECTGEPSIRFAASAQDVGDAGLGLIDLAGSPRGPAHIVLVVPSQRRARLRPEFAFEFASFVKFLCGPEAAGWEEPLYEYMDRVLKGAAGTATIVFSIETPHAAHDLRVHLAHSAEKLAMCLTASLAEKDAIAERAINARGQRGSLSTCSRGSLSATFGRSGRSPSRVRLEYPA